MSTRSQGSQGSSTRSTQLLLEKVMGSVAGRQAFRLQGRIPQCRYLNRESFSSVPTRMISDQATASFVTKLRCDLTDPDRYIHFNNAGDSPMPRSVLRRTQTALEQEHIVGGYAAFDENITEFTSTYDVIGKLINARAPQDEIALVDSATTAWVRAFYSLPLKEGDAILVSQIEYAANYVAILQQAKRLGLLIEIIPSRTATMNGNDYVHSPVCLKSLRELLRKYNTSREGTDVAKAAPTRTRRSIVVSITWIPTNGGVIADAVGIGEVVQEFKMQSTTEGGPMVFYLLDACQAVGHISVDVQRLHCDMLTATGRKYLRGPRGTGFLYISRGCLPLMDEPPTIDHSAAPWSCEISDTLGMYAVSGDVKHRDTPGSSTGNRTTAVFQSKYTLLDSAKRYEQWEKNVAGLLGLGAAVDYAMRVDQAAVERGLVLPLNNDNNSNNNNFCCSWSEHRIRHLAMVLRMRLNSIDSVRVWDLGFTNPIGVSNVLFALKTKEGKEDADALSTYNMKGGQPAGESGSDSESAALCGIVTFSAEGVAAVRIKQSLRQKNIFVSVSTPTSTLVDATARQLPDLVRASLHYFNTEAEIDAFCEAVEEIVEAIHE